MWGNGKKLNIRYNRNMYTLLKCYVSIKKLNFYCMYVAKTQNSGGEESRKVVEKRQEEKKVEVMSQYYRYVHPSYIGDVAAVPVMSQK